MALDLAEGPHFTALREAVFSKTLSCPTGTFKLEQDSTALYYRNSRYEPPSFSSVDFSNPSEDDLKALAEACDPATFGRADQDVYDESYRKAGKLNATHFAINFHPGPAGLLDEIRDVLLEGYNFDTEITAELYKLNVYGPGSFFKAHKDTPRGQTMFASLVVVLPTEHEGGALIFRHEDQEIKFDSALALAGEDEPAVAYAAFFSDIEHEVEEVRAGYRITLTYNLYRTRVRRSGHTLPETVDDYVSNLADTFDALLNDETFLPDGGLVGFGLRHDYPVFTGLTILGADLNSLYDSLKGSDALLAQVCRQLELDWDIKVVYNGDTDSNCYILCENTLYLGEDCLDDEYDTDIMAMLLGEKLGKELMTDPSDVYKTDSKGHKRKSKQRTHVYWATPTSPYMSETVCVVYGNEPSMGHAYGRACLIVDVEPYEQRTNVVEPTEPEVVELTELEVAEQTELKVVEQTEPEVAASET
ncbi:hypothetical protein BDW22DRAFT_1353163 [Trametopsis cervina]|nr:hypothetical protein BDW22DRAFT_1353163 [Trametopsis cervina]